MAAILMALAAAAALFLAFCGLSVVALASAHRRAAAVDERFEAIPPVAANRSGDADSAARTPAPRPQPAH